MVSIKLPKIETNLAREVKTDADDAPQSVIHVPDGFKTFVCIFDEYAFIIMLTKLEYWK